MLHEEIVTLRTSYDVLMAALARKCEQYIGLKMQMQKQSEKTLVRAGGIHSHT